MSKDDPNPRVKHRSCLQWYRAVWTTLMVGAVLVGLVAAFVQLDPLAAGSMFAAGVVIAWMFGLALTPEGQSPMKTASYCAYAGVATVAFVGLLTLIEGWAVVLTIVLIVIEPRILKWWFSDDNGVATALGGKSKQVNEQVDETVTDMRIEPAALDNASLCRAWRASGLALSKVRSGRVTLALVCYREQCLEELTRRFPIASIKWLDEGPPAGADPRTYLPPVMDRLRAP